MLPLDANCSSSITWTVVSAPSRNSALLLHNDTSQYLTVCQYTHAHACASVMHAGIHICLTDSAPSPTTGKSWKPG